MRSDALWLAMFACLNLAIGVLPAPAAAHAISFCGTPPRGHGEPTPPPVSGGACHAILCVGDRQKPPAGEPERDGR